ncbi:uncharacterized protein LOC144582222 isoform X2 [Callithrix jacchus]
MGPSHPRSRAEPRAHSERVLDVSGVVVFIICLVPKASTEGHGPALAGNWSGGSRAWRGAGLGRVRGGAGEGREVRSRLRPRRRCARDWGSRNRGRGRRRRTARARVRNKVTPKTSPTPPGVPARATSRGARRAACDRLHGAPRPTRGFRQEATW